MNKFFEKWDNFLDEFNSRWTEHKKKHETTATVESGLVGATSGVLSGCCLRSSISRLIDKESTYGGVGPVFTAVSGMIFGLISLSSFSEFGKLLKEQQAKNKKEKEELNKHKEN